jgi:hypothetical protein
VTFDEQGAGGVATWRMCGRSEMTRDIATTESRTELKKYSAIIAQQGELDNSITVHSLNCQYFTANVSV